LYADHRDALLRRENVVVPAEPAGQLPSVDDGTAARRIAEEEALICDAEPIPGPVLDEVGRAI
jgi:hypothetical protein